MADGNIFTSLGLDLQLITAGAAGGLVKSIMDRSKPLDSAGAMFAGGLVANYSSDTVVTLAANGVLFGYRMTVQPGVAGFFVGVFAFLIVGWLATKLRGRLTE